MNARFAHALSTELESNQHLPLIRRLHCHCTIGGCGIRGTLPAVALRGRARCLAVPAWSRRLESNQPNVLYPKQAAHLAPPPRKTLYPDVELNHASDVRSVGPDPSAGAFMELLVGVAPPHRITSAGHSLECCEQRSERIEHRAGIEPTFRALQARALPLGYRCAVQVRGLEPR